MRSCALTRDSSSSSWRASGSAGSSAASARRARRRLPSVARRTDQEVAARRVVVAQHRPDDDVDRSSPLVERRPARSPPRPAVRSRAAWCSAVRRSARRSGLHQPQQVARRLAAGHLQETARRRSDTCTSCSPRSRSATAARTARAGAGAARPARSARAAAARRRAAAGGSAAAAIVASGSAGRRHRAALVDVRVLVDRTNRSSAPSGVSDAPRNRKAAGPQREMKRLDDPLLHRPIQIDQQVAAGDQIEMRERRIADDVVVREQHHLAQLAANPVAAGLALEEARAGAPRRDVGDVRFAVEALARRGDRLLVEIGGEHLDRAARRPSSTRARPAAWPPNRLPRRWRSRPPRREPGRRAPCCSNRRWESLAARAPSNAVGVAEEIGDADQQLLHQQRRFLRRCRA